MKKITFVIDGKRRHLNENIVLAFKLLEYAATAFLGYVCLWLTAAVLFHL